MLLIVGCNNIVAMSQKELLTTEGFIAVAVAVNQRGIKIEEEKQALIIKQEAEEKANAEKAKLEEEARIKVEQELELARKAQELKDKESVAPKKYLRLFSSESGCGSCIHQDTILIGAEASKWIFHKGSEEENKDKKPYHGIIETVESLNDVNNPLWKKYKTESVPRWQLIEDGKIIKTYSGVLTLPQLKDFYLNTSKTVGLVNVDCTCDVCKCGQCGCTK